MSGNDDVIFNTRERPMSSDQNNVQSVIARAFMDALMFGSEARFWGVLTASPAGVSQPLVLGGLRLTPSGSSVAVSAGAIVQRSASLDPVPGSLDSEYRLGIMRDDKTLTTPSPVGDTYYLIECQVERVVTSTESRDVLNEITGNFEPQMLDKRSERQIAFQFKAGDASNFPLPTGGDWVLLGGVFRPAGGGAVLDAHLYDMRLQPGVADVPVARPGFLTQRSYCAVVDNPDITGGASPGVLGFSMFDIDGELFGQRVWFHLNNLIYAWLSLRDESCDPDNDPRALAHGEWYYLYLAPFSGSLPVGQPVRMYNVVTPGEEVLHGGFLRGVLVESTVPPVMQGGNTNGAALSLPAPFNAYTVPAGNAMLIGAFQRAGATGFTGCRAEGNVVQIAPDDTNVATDNVEFSSNTWAGGTDQQVNLAGKLPVSARAAEIELFYEKTSGGAATTLMLIKAFLQDMYIHRLQFANTELKTTRFWLPLVSQYFTGARVDRVYITQSNAGTASLILTSFGFTEGVM